MLTLSYTKTTEIIDCISSTPLPPVPALDKRSQSIQQGDNYYDDGHLYDKPVTTIYFTNTQFKEMLIHL